MGGRYTALSSRKIFNPMLAQSLNVFKFGGASLKDAAPIRNVASILEGFKGDRLVIIVSAMGKTTNALEVIARAYTNGDTETARRKLSELHNATMTTVGELFGGTPPELEVALNDLFVSVEWVFDDEPNESYDYDYDQIVSLGELISSQLVAAYLNHAGLPTSWLDARDCIITDNTYREGWVQWPETQARISSAVPPLLDEGKFVLTQGFIGSTTENFTTTLGREGSDYSAAIFSYCLDAEAMSIWKDVPGVLTADPRLFENVSKIDRLSYKEAIEMTYYGASIIHPKTIKPLQNKSIPLHVRSFLEPKSSGTEITREGTVAGRQDAAHSANGGEGGTGDSAQELVPWSRAPPARVYVVPWLLKCVFRYTNLSVSQPFSLPLMAPALAPPTLSVATP